MEKKVKTWRLILPQNGLKLLGYWIQLWPFLSKLQYKFDSYITTEHVRFKKKKKKNETPNIFLPGNWIGYLNGGYATDVPVDKELH